MTQIVRSTVTGAKPELELRELQTLYNSTSVQDDMEHLEPYGFTSEPFTDGQTDAVNLYFDDERNHGVVINVADRRYRIKDMQQGEVAIYDDKGRYIYIKRDCIEVNGVSSPINVKTSGTVNVTAPTVNITGNVNIKGNVVITGTLNTSSTISAQGSISSGSINLSTHVHTGDSGGTTSGPR